MNIFKIRSVCKIKFDLMHLIYFGFYWVEFAIIFIFFFFRITKSYESYFLSISFHNSNAFVYFVFSLWFVYLKRNNHSFSMFLVFVLSCLALPCLLFIVLNMCINVCNQHQHQRIPHPFPHLSLPPPPTTDRVIDTLAMPPNVTAALQQKQHQSFIPPPAPNKFAHMHNVSGFIYNL